VSKRWLLWGLLAALVLATAALASAAVVQRGNLRITVLSQVEPYKLPRHGTAPIAVFVSGHIATPSEETPPQLQRMTIEVNKHGLLQSRGLPTCSLNKIRTATSANAIAQCGDALVGSGRFYASVVFPGQRPYPTRGRLLVFNGKEGGRSVIYAHIYTESPFASSFVIPFVLRHVNHGPYGTELSASLPAALGEWGFVDRIKMTIGRQTHSGEEGQSFLNASCPAPRGTRTAAFPLALADFAFGGGRSLHATVTKSCGVKG
jgi:hypothetical protein